MTDIAIVWRDFDGSIAIENADLLQDNSLKSAVIISLFTDRLANKDDVLPDQSAGRKGWWADGFSNDDFIGSRLWLLHREKQTLQVLERAREYAFEALAWLIDDGIAGAIEVVASNPKQGFLVLDINIDRPQGDETFQFSSFWEAL